MAGREKTSKSACALTVDGKKAAMPKSIATAGGLLEALGISTEEALVRIGGRVVPDTASLPGRGKIEVIRVVYGG